MYLRQTFVLWHLGKHSGFYALLTLFVVVSIFFSFSLFLCRRQKCVPRRGTLYNSYLDVTFFRFVSHLQAVTATVASQGGMCTFSLGKVTSIEMRLCDLSLFSTFSLLSFLFRFCIVRKKVSLAQVKRTNPKACSSTHFFSSRLSS